MQERSPQQDLQDSSSEPTFGREEQDQQEETKQVQVEREKAIQEQIENQEVQML